MLESTVHSHAYLIQGAENILIDTGMPSSADRILQELNSLGAAKLNHILLTHHDVDHMGNAQQIQQKTGAKLWAPEEDIPYITGEKKRPGVKLLVGALVRPKVPMVSGGYSSAPDFDGIKVIHAPGHTPGHVIFTYRDVVFLGDLFKIVDGVFQPMPAYLTWSRAEAAKSVALLKTLDFEWLCPAHGQPMRRNAALEQFLRQY